MSKHCSRDLARQTWQQQLTSNAKLPVLDSRLSWLVDAIVSSISNADKWNAQSDYRLKQPLQEVY